MSRVVVNHGIGRPLVEVCSDVVTGKVGLIARPGLDQVWTDLTPAEADAVAAVLIQAASETRAEAAGSSSGATP